MLLLVSFPAVLILYDFHKLVELTDLLICMRPEQHEHWHKEIKNSLNGAIPTNSPLILSNLA